MDFPFIYGAQYYRAPTPDREFWADDLRRMAKNGFNHVKFWAQWRWIHRASDKFYFEDLDELMDIAAKCGLSVTINVIFDTAPAWVFDEYPDCGMVTSAGQAIEQRTVLCRQIGGYPGPCLNHPGAQAAREAFLREVVSRYAGHPAMGMWDVWNEPESNLCIRQPEEETLLCYCPSCRAEFLNWLRGKYGDIESLNRVWGRCYGSWREVELPHDRKTLVDMVDWRLFQTASLAGEARRRVSAAKSIDHIHPVYLHPVSCTLEDFNPVTCADDFAMSEGCDCFGGTTNGVPSATLQTISSAKGRVCYNAESHLRCGGTAMYPKPLTVRDFANTFVPQIGLGIHGFLHWQYRAETLGLESPGWGLLDTDGRVGTTHEAAVEFWRRLSPVAERLADSAPEDADVAILKSTPNEIFQWCVYGNFDNVRDGVDGYTRLLYGRNVHLAYVNDGMLVEGLSPKIKVLVVPVCYAMTQGTADALARWVKDGGTLVCEAHTGGYNLSKGRHALDLPGLGLSEALGLRECNATAVPHLGISKGSTVRDLQGDLGKAMKAFGMGGSDALDVTMADGGTLSGWERYTELEGEGLEEIACLPGRGPCAATKAVGRGRVFYIGTLAGTAWRRGASDGLERLMERVLASAGLSFEASGVRVDTLRTADGQALAVSNLSPDAARMVIPVDESMIGLFSEQRVEACGALDLGPGDAELLVPSRWLGLGAKAGKRVGAAAG